MDPLQMPSGVPQQDNTTPVSPEQKKVLLDMIDKIQAKIGSVKALRMATSKSTDILRQKMLKDMFDKLQNAGVDLSDRQSVSDFLAKLKLSNPELADMFEQSMNVLLGGQPQQQDESQLPPENASIPSGSFPDQGGMMPEVQNNMNIQNENIPKG